MKAVDNKFSDIDEEIWNTTINSILDEEMKDEVEVISSILEKLSPRDNQFTKPKLALLGLIKRSQEFMIQQNPPVKKIPR